MSILNKSVIALEIRRLQADFKIIKVHGFKLGTSSFFTFVIWSKVCPLQPLQRLWKPIQRSAKQEELDLVQEREIVLRCQNGDADAMGILVVQYQHWVYNIAYGMLSHHQDAEDIAQDAFVSAWENIGEIPIPVRASRHGCFRIVKNKCL